MTDKADDGPIGDVIELNVEDLPTWAALMKANPIVAETLLRSEIFRVVHQHDVAHNPETLTYQESQFQWIMGRIAEETKLKVVKK